jgi:hypothetical protein
VLSFYDAHVMSVWFSNDFSVPYYYWYRLCFYIIITIIIIIIIIIIIMVYEHPWKQDILKQISG